MIPIIIKTAGLSSTANRVVRGLARRMPTSIRHAIVPPSMAEKAITTLGTARDATVSRGTRWLQDFTGSPEAARRRIMEETATQLLRRKGIEDVRALEELYQIRYHPAQGGIPRVITNLGALE